MTLLYPSICIVQIQLVQTISYNTQSRYDAPCIPQYVLYRYNSMLTISYNTQSVSIQIWCSFIPQYVLYRYNSILNSMFLNRTFVSISIRIQLYLFSQISVLQDTTQSRTQGSSMICLYLSRYNLSWHFVLVPETN